jgi:outer membrane protein OmpA-like peptidoglycan-associated protein
MRQTKIKAMLLLTVVGVVASGCASKKYVRAEVATSETRVAERLDGVETTVEQNQDLLMEQGAELDRLSDATAELSQTAREALDRAIEAGKLAEGKFVYETILSDDRVRFGFDKADLSSDAKEALDTFSADLLARNEGVFVEIQGHTDNTGSENYNLELGERRAQSVMRYLSSQGGLPLHRLSAISYGETAPVSDNGTSEGRAQNRRVALVVLR